MPVLGKKSKSKKQLPALFEGAEKALPRGRIGMRGRIFGIMLIFCLVMLTFLWLFQIIYLDVFYEFVKTDQIKSASQNIVEHLGEEDLQDLVVELAKQRQICITVYKVEYPELFQLGVSEVAGADVLTNCIIHHIGVSSLAQFYEAARAQGNIFSEPLYPLAVQL